MTRAGRLLRLWGPAALWATAIFGASAQSDLGPAARVPDWASHGAAYAVLGWLVCRALAGGWRRRLSGRALLLAVALSTAYGVSDELHQSRVPRRDASAADVVKDFAGALLGAVSFRRLAAAAQPVAAA